MARVEAATRISPSSIDVRRMTGLVAWHRHDYPVAERVFQGLVQESPGDFQASNLLILTLAEQDDGARQQRAEQLAAMNTRLYPNASEPPATLGMVQARLGLPEQAERAFRTAVGRGNLSSDSVYFLARFLAGRDRLAEVGPLLRMALEAPGRFAYRTEARALAGQLPAGNTVTSSKP